MLFLFNLNNINQFIPEGRRSDTEEHENADFITRNRGDAQREDTLMCPETIVHCLLAHCEYRLALQHLWHCI